MTQPSGFYGWKLLAVFWLIIFTNFAFPLYGASVINAYMAADLHMDRAALGAAYGLFQWMVGLPAPLVAICINKKGVRFTMLAGCVTVAAGALLMAFAVHNVWQVYLVFGVIVGLGALSGGILGAQAGIGRWFVKSKARAITLVHTGGTFGGFVAAPVLNHVIAKFGGNWRAGWILIAGLSFAASILAFFFIKENPADLGQFPDGASGAEAPTASPQARTAASGAYKTTDSWTFGEVFRTPAIWMFLIAILGFSTGYPLFLAHGVVHLRDLGYTAGEAAFSVSVMLLASLGGNVVFRGSRRSRRAPIRVGGGFGAVRRRNDSGAARERRGGTVSLRDLSRRGIRRVVLVDDGAAGELLRDARVRADRRGGHRRRHDGGRGRACRGWIHLRPLRQLRTGVLCGLGAELLRRAAPAFRRAAGPQGGGLCARRALDLE